MYYSESAHGSQPSTYTWSRARHQRFTRGGWTRTGEMAAGAGSRGKSSVKPLSANRHRTTHNSGHRRFGVPISVPRRSNACWNLPSKRPVKPSALGVRRCASVERWKLFWKVPPCGGTWTVRNPTVAVPPPPIHCLYWVRPKSDKATSGRTAKEVRAEEATAKRAVGGA